MTEQETGFEGSVPLDPEAQRSDQDSGLGKTGREGIDGGMSEGVDTDETNRRPDDEGGEGAA